MEEEGEKMLGSFSGSGGMIMMGGTGRGRYGETWAGRLDATQVGRRELGTRNGEKCYAMPGKRNETTAVDIFSSRLPQVLRGKPPRLTGTRLYLFYTCIT